jgi:cytochrome b involved in lipid metabolism
MSNSSEGSGGGRLMNDSTMPPPKLSSSSSSSKKPAVNPRLQKGVAKGFGLHDWKRLLMTAKDLAQRKGAPIRRDITIDEVKLHNKVYDGWMILRGKVYNIGPYLHYHPGGVNIMKGVLGKDGTKLFDKYHRWVNIEGLIAPLLLGVLVVPIREEERMSYSDHILPPKESGLSVPRIFPKLAAGGTLFLPRPDDDEEEEQILPC